MQISYCILILLLSLSALTQNVLKSQLLLSSPRSTFTSIEVDGKIYFAGGFENGDLASSAIDVFDIATQTLNTTLELSTPRSYISPAVVPPHIFFVGGWRLQFNTGAYLYSSGPPRNLNNLANVNVRDPTQISIYGATLFVLGSHNAEFMDLTNTTSGWSIIEEVDYVLQRIAGGVKFTHENLIFMFGGVNVSSRQPLTDAWLFDIDSSNMTRYENVINPIGYIGSDEYSFSVTNDVMSVWTRSGDVILFNIETSTWLNLTFTKVIDVISVPGFTFIFKSGAFFTVDWTQPNADPSVTAPTAQIILTVDYGDQAAYFYNEDSVATTMRCTTNGTWTNTSVTPLITSVTKTLLWPSYGSVIVTDQGLYLFNNCSVTFTALSRIQTVAISYPSADLLYVLVAIENSLTASLRIYNSTLGFVQSHSVPLMNIDLCFDNMLIDFTNKVALSINTSLTVDIFNGPFGSGTLWAVQGEYFVAVAAQTNSAEFVSQVDIYNYENNTWMEPATVSEGQLSSGYNQAFNLNGVLGILTTTGILKFDITTYNWTEEPFIDGSKNKLPAMTIGPVVVEVNGTAYATTSVVQLKIFADGVRDSVLIDDEHNPTQIIHHKPTNQLFISTYLTRIYTWDIDNQNQDVFFFPRQNEPEFIIATSGNFLLASAITSEQFDYCDLSSSRWDKVTGVNNYFRPSSMRSFTFNGTDLILTAGGQDKKYLFCTDVVRIFDISSLELLPPIPESEPLAPTSGPDNGRPSDNTTLIVAIVVPVGTVLIAGALVAFFLIRRHKKKKSRGNRASVIGLENQYGQWFIPFSDLTFHEQLGQGGSGQVFKGSWKNTSVALKLSMTQANNSVISELSLMMQLRPHPNVVQLLGFSVHPETDSIVLVLEYCNQGALDELLFNDKTSIPLKQKLEWLIGISKGLSHLHSNNIVHRDVAARNVLLHQNEAKLTDFGMSRIVDDEQQRGTTKSELGPIRWMSPESLKRKEYSTKSDVWSFGIVAFEIIAQQEPHVDKDPIQVGQEIRDSGLTPHLPDTCPNDLASVIKSCWHMEPSQRPSSEQIISQLEDVLSRL